MNEFKKVKSNNIDSVEFNKLFLKKAFSNTNSKY